MSHLDIAGSVDQAGATGQAGQVDQVDATDAIGSAGTEGISPSGTPMREWLAEALATASDGEVSAEEILSADSPFVALGITSIAMVRLVDAIEAELDVFIEFGGDTWFLKDLDSLTGYLTGLART
jgi:acyl carrier protein